MYRWIDLSTIYLFTITYRPIISKYFPTMIPSHIVTLIWCTWGEASAARCAWLGRISRTVCCLDTQSLHTSFVSWESFFNARSVCREKELVTNHLVHPPSECVKMSTTKKIHKPSTIIHPALNLFEFHLHLGQTAECLWNGSLRLLKKSGSWEAFGKTTGSNIRLVNFDDV